MDIGQNVSGYWARSHSNLLLSLGYAPLQKKLRQAVEWPIKHAGAFSRMGVSPLRGILLHGPPGCSKTTLAKAAAHAAQASFFSLRYNFCILDM